MNTDKITTIIGAVTAAGVAAGPVLNTVQGSLHAQDYFALFSAVCMAVWGFFTNRQPKTP